MSGALIGTHDHARRCSTDGTADIPVRLFVAEHEALADTDVRGTSIFRGEPLST